MSLSATNYRLLLLTGLFTLCLTMLEKSFAEEFDAKKDYYSIESLERYLEMGRHKQLVSQKNAQRMSFQLLPQTAAAVACR